jgi:hypothetical protein
MPARRLVASAAAAVAVAATMVGALTWLAAPAGERDIVDRAQRPVTASPMRVGPGTTLAPRPACDRVAHRFRPRVVSVPGATRGAAVVAPPRDANDIPGVPPLTDAGKSLVAWDREQGIRPGDPAGNVLLNAHTWPDGSALGNRLLATLHHGDRIVVRGAGLTLCYRVTERVEVLASRGLPRYYDKDGPPRLALLVCSGRRLGPGVWEKRTVWFAAPSA